MILHDKLEKPYEECTVRTKIWLSCDYCGKVFLRDKKQILRSHKNILKDACSDRICANKKRQEVSKILHGNEHYFCTKKFAEQCKKTNLEKYGEEEYFSSKDFASKRKSALVDKYGVKNPLQSKDIREKQSQTVLEKYGVSNYSQSPDFIKKTRESCLKKFGESSPMRLDSTKQKRKNTCRQQYGADSYTKTEDYWEKRKKTCLAKYGVDHTHKNPEVIRKMKATTLDRYGVESYSQLQSAKDHYKQTCLQKYGVPNMLCLQQNRIFGQTQEKIRTWLNDLGFSFSSDYTIMNGKEIDLYDPNANIAIEYCGLYWHNECSPEPRNRMYHYDKYVACTNKHINLFTIFEDEWKLKNLQCRSILLSKLNKSQYKIGARKCKCVTVSKAAASTFMQEHHLLGQSRHSVFCVGLEYEDSLVAVMSLGRHPRDSKNIVLDRLCFKTNYQIIGGASKLFSSCKQWAKDRKSIITWSDNRWSNGGIYETMGFLLEANLSPDYSYVNIAKPYHRISKQSQKKSHTGCPANKTEHEFALENGLARIWDCGKTRWRFDI